MTSATLFSLNLINLSYALLPCVFTFMFQNGKLLLYSLGVHPNFFRKASLKWLMLLYPTNPAMSFT